MRFSLIATLLLAAGLAAFAQDTAPRMASADPASGKKGDIIAVTGINLDKGCVVKVYLTDGKHDTLVEVTEQTQTSIKFKIPGGLEVGTRFALMVLTPGANPKLIEQPVKVLIEGQ